MSFDDEDDGLDDGWLWGEDGWPEDDPEELEDWGNIEEWDEDDQLTPDE
jgi:hypothetical protein